MSHGNRQVHLPPSLSSFPSLHSPLSEVAKMLLEFGANINTHSNEFKESALTLACYKGHLEMVEFLLSSGELVKDSSTVPRTMLALLLCLLVVDLVVT